ncbi:MAG: UDP-N-acetylmuramoyl-tripeptide--D-alanyl-D-alanine ligase [Pseudomonadota bacterium]
MWPLEPEFIKTVFPHSKIKEPISGASTDSRSILNTQMFIALKGGRFDGHDYLLELFKNGLKCALVSEEWAQNAPEELKDKLLYKGDSVQGLRELARAFRKRLPFPVIGIGGSNGKTTTKEMLAALLSGRQQRVTKTEKSENGFIGVAKTLIQNAHTPRENIGALVLEIGIDQKKAMASHMELAQPDCVLLTALGPEHLEGLGGWNDAILEEIELFKLSKGKPRVWQLSEPKIWDFSELVDEQDCFVVYEEDISRGSNAFGRSKLSDFNLLHWHMETERPDRTVIYARWIEKTKESKLLCFTVPLPGLHNANNFALALATALHLGWTHEEVLKGWKNFEVPPMRSRIIYLKENICLFDDCYNASPSSMKAAFASLDHGDWRHRKKVVVLGDMLDLGAESLKWHLDILPALLAISHATIFLYGEAMGKIYLALNDKLKSRIFHIVASDNPIKRLEESGVGLTDSIILVKGSRGMQLERVVKHLETKFATV